jgi:dTDP-4-amino-4,6-dideoxygalactose transaminase
MPVETHDPDGLINYLRSNGFDASQKASSLVHLKTPGYTTGTNDLKLDKLVYLPAYPPMSKRERKRLGELINDFA